MKNKFDLLILFLMISIASLLPKATGQESKGKIIVTFDQYLCDIISSGWGPSADESYSNDILDYQVLNCSITEINFRTDILDFSEFFIRMFESKSSFIISIEFSGMNINGIENMERMFANLPNLQKIVGLESLNTSNVTNMGGMFFGDSNLNVIDVSNFRTSKVTNMEYMFSNTPPQTQGGGGGGVGGGGRRVEAGERRLDSSEDFQIQKRVIVGLSNFDTSSVTNMGGMFAFNYNIESLNLSNFNTAKVTSMVNMFCYCLNLINLDISNFDTSSVTDMYQMFSFVGLVKKLDSFSDLKNVSNYPGLESLNLSNFDTSNVNNMSYMFFGDFHLKEIDVSSFNTSKVTNMEGMFAKVKKRAEFDPNILPSLEEIRKSSIQKIIGLSNFDTSSVTSMERMFALSANIESLDLSNFNTSSVSNMGMMFYECQGLKYLDISNFNMENLEKSNSNEIVTIGNYSNLKYINIYNIQQNANENFKASLEYSQFNYDGLSICQKEKIIENGTNICCSIDFENTNCSNYFIF